MPMKKADPELERHLAERRAEYADEEREAAEYEMFQARAGIVDVTLPKDVYAAVRDIATKQKTTPHALLRDWAIERLAAVDAAEDAAAVVADLRRDVERVARMISGGKDARAAS